MRVPEVGARASDAEDKSDAEERQAPEAASAPDEEEEGEEEDALQAEEGEEEDALETPTHHTRAWRSAGPDALTQDRDALTPGDSTRAPGSSCVTESNVTSCNVTSSYTTLHPATQEAQTQEPRPASARERGAGRGGVGAARKGMKQREGAETDANSETDANRSGGGLGAGITDGQMRGGFPRAVAWGSAEQRDEALVSLRAALAHVQLP